MAVKDPRFKEPSKNNAVSDVEGTLLSIRSNRAAVFDTVQCSLYSLPPEAYWKLGCFEGVSCTTSVWCATFARQ
jgi:hypothetical protein